MPRRSTYRARQYRYLRNQARQAAEWHRHVEGQTTQSFSPPDHRDLFTAPQFNEAWRPTLTLRISGFGVVGLVTLATLSLLLSTAEATALTREDPSRSLMLRGGVDPLGSLELARDGLSQEFVPRKHEEPLNTTATSAPKKLTKNQEKRQRKKEQTEKTVVQPPRTLRAFTDSMSRTQLFTPHEGSDTAIAIYVKPSGTSDDNIGQICARPYDLSTGALTGTEFCFANDGKRIGNIGGGTLASDGALVVTYAIVDTPTTTKLYLQRLHLTGSTLSTKGEARVLIYSGSLDALSYGDSITHNQLAIAIPKGANPIEIQVRNCQFAECFPITLLKQTQEYSSGKPQITLNLDGEILLSTQEGAMTCYNYAGVSHSAEALTPPQYPISQTPPQARSTAYGFFVSWPSSAAKGDGVDFYTQHFDGSTCSRIGTAEKDLSSVAISGDHGNYWLRYDVELTDDGSRFYFNNNGPDGPELYIPYKEPDAHQRKYFRYVLENEPSFDPQTARARQDGRKNLLVSWSNGDRTIETRRLLPTLITYAEINVSAQGEPMRSTDLAVFDAMKGTDATHDTRLQADGGCKVSVRNDDTTSFSLAEVTADDVKVRAETECRLNLKATHNGVLAPLTAAVVSFFKTPDDSPDLSWLPAIIGSGVVLLALVGALVIICRYRRRDYERLRDQIAVIDIRRDEERELTEVLPGPAPRPAGGNEA